MEAVKVSELSAYSAASLGVNLIEPLHTQDSIKGLVGVAERPVPTGRRLGCLDQSLLVPS